MKTLEMAIALGVAVSGATLAHVSQRSADEIRRHDLLDDRYHYMPSPEAMRVIAMGMNQQVADILWFRTVLGFSDRMGQSDKAWGEWLFRMLLAVSELDPTWRTPYFYGGSLLRSVYAYDASTELFRLGHENIPTDPYFPFSVGMNYYLHHDNPLEAARWINVASELPNAPDWYKKAASGIIMKKESRKIGLEYLRNELSKTDDEQMRAHLNEQINRLLQDELAEQLTKQLPLYKERAGEDLTSPDDLVGELLVMLPVDPMGGHWVLDPEGDIVSSVVATERDEDAQKIERRTLRYRTVRVTPE